MIFNPDMRHLDLPITGRTTGRFGTCPYGRDDRIGNEGNGYPVVPRRRSIRLKQYDYSSAGVYFVTICAQNRENLFGDIVVGAGSEPARLSEPALSPKPAQMALNQFGKIVEYTWDDLPNHNTGIELDEFVIMPNHVHGIVSTHRPGGQVLNLPLHGHTIAAGTKTTHRHGLPEIVRQFKTFSSRRINQLRNVSGTTVWQRNYYEHIIRDETELNRIRDYIRNNPLNWETDNEFTGKVI